MPDLDAPLPVRPSLFLCHYARRRAWLFGALLLLIVAASPCSVGVQYGMKLIVNAMVGDDYTSDTIWRWLALFVLLITAERACWRLSD